jgi:hydroxymethylpyrimidine pyrophosphatase-like HAD family hydrolase
LSKIITCDFDETLAVTSSTAWGGTVLVPVERVVNFVKSKIDSGFHVYIVTFRNWDTKTEFVKKLNSSLHIDDHIETCTLLTMAGIEVLLVDWGQEDTNLMAQFFNKI